MSQLLLAAPGLQLSLDDLPTRQLYVNTADVGASSLSSPAASTSTTGAPSLGTLLTLHMVHAGKQV